MKNVSTEQSYIGHTRIVGCLYADWERSPTHSWSTCGYCILVGDNLITSRSKQQNVETNKIKCKSRHLWTYIWGFWNVLQMSL